VPLQVEPRLVEIHQGDWDARLHSEIEKVYPDLLRQWETDPWATTPPGSERLEEVQRRVYAADRFRPLLKCSAPHLAPAQAPMVTE
jgi:broad specificity phosphatase PhoE